MTSQEESTPSYTAQKLQHATPSHLHATTRRLFIGPIPEAWLSKHRKSWYKYRPHLSTYSSRTATFNAGSNVSNTKSVTGLDESTHSDRPRGVSFPQPEDVDGSDDADSQLDGPSSPVSGSLSALAPEEINSGQPSQSGVETPSTTAKKSRRKVSLKTRPKIRQFSSRSWKSTKSSGGESFVTAQESLGNSELNTPTVNRVDSTSSLLNKVLAADSERPSIAGQSLERLDSYLDVDQQPPRESRKHNSTAEREHKTVTFSDQVDGQQNYLDGSAQSADQADVSSSSALRQVDPISTGLVRFEVTETRNVDEIHQIDQIGKKPKRSFRGFMESKSEPGRLLKAERMLVKVDWTANQIEDDYTENDSLRIEPKVVKKWREYVVVCRQNTESSKEFVLQMAKTRVIPAMDQKPAKRRFVHEIPLSKGVTKISMFSSLDKTIAMSTKSKSGTMVYILRPSSAASSVEWFTFLNSALGWKRPLTLTVNVPDLNVTMEITNPFEALKGFRGVDRTHSNASSSGDEESASIQAVEGAVAKDIINKCLKALENSPVSTVVDLWAKNEKKLGLAWKRYDRLEWIYGAQEAKMYGSMAMQKSHDLELRPKEHYPTRAEHFSGIKPALEEPPPVEGFLVRLTSQKGRHSRYGKTFFKRLYYSTHNQYFAFCQPANAMPPRPMKMPRGPRDELLSASELAEKVPLIFTINPYPVDRGEVKWLRGDTASSTKIDFDQYAFQESERNIKNLSQAQGYLDLCDVVLVRKFRREAVLSQGQDVHTAVPPDQEDGQASIHEESEDGFEDETTQVAADARTFELTMKNGLTVRLQAYDILARKEWVKRLRELIKYWKLRTVQDMNVYKSVRSQNQESLEVDEQMEAFLGQYAQKWEVTRSIASSELFNMCGISCCRSINMSGILYYKPKLRGSFEKCNVILSHGKLFVFQYTLRKFSGKAIRHIHHERREVIDLKDSYIYSGLLTEDNLLYQNRTFDSNHPGHHVLPRVYEDNWTSNDEDTMMCFVVWHSKSKSLFRANTQQDYGKIKHNLRYVSSLGTAGRSMVFQTRSRAERDHWVMSLNMEIERLQEAGDIRVTSHK